MPNSRIQPRPHVSPVGSPCIFPDLHPLSSHDSESELNVNLTQQSLAPNSDPLNNSLLKDQDIDMLPRSPNLPGDFNHDFDIPDDDGFFDHNFNIPDDDGFFNPLEQDDEPHDNGGSPRVEGHPQAEGHHKSVPTFTRVYHPHINGVYIHLISPKAHTHSMHVGSLGTPCDINRNVVLPDTPPPPHDSEANSNDWTPYNSQAKFELTKLLYTHSQMPTSEIDHLLNIWAATHVADGQDPPFKDHKDMYATIDMTPLGDVAWESFEVQYSGELPDGDIPSWMTANYTVWFHDPHALVQHILSNPNFCDNFDYSPLQEHDAEGNHWYKDFMSGNWCWIQAVSYFFNLWCSLQVLTTTFRI